MKIQGYPAATATITGTARPVLSIEQLSVSLRSHGASLPIVKELSFAVYPGKTLALVGESGCGKSMAMLAIMGLIPRRQLAAMTGNVFLQGQSLSALSPAAMNRLRGNRIAMIFQEPMSCLNPTMKIGEQIAEPLLIHKGMQVKKARARAIELLAETGIENPRQRAKQYPFEFSGGMLQRVMIAMALACEPDVIIADEPTTALDVTTQKQVLDLLKALQKKHGTALVLITHDLGVVSTMADDVAVMYAGQLVEYGSLQAVFDNSAHPYTLALKKSTPALQQRGQLLLALAGTPPPAGQLHAGCSFVNRCLQARTVCDRLSPEMITLPPGMIATDRPHIARCWLHHADNPELGRNSAQIKRPGQDQAQ